MRIFGFKMLIIYVLLYILANRLIQIQANSNVKYIF